MLRRLPSAIPLSGEDVETILSIVLVRFAHSKGLKVVLNRPGKPKAGEANFKEVVDLGSQDSDSGSDPVEIPLEQLDEAVRAVRLARLGLPGEGGAGSNSSSAFLLTAKPALTHSHCSTVAG